MFASHSLANHFGVLVNKHERFRFGGVGSAGRGVEKRSGASLGNGLLCSLLDDFRKHFLIGYDVT